MRFVAAASLILVLQPATPPPNTDIFLASLSNEAGALTVGRPVNVTNSPGYDNQPSFTPDGRQILFTSIRGGTQTDIYRYDIAGRTVARVTDTPDSEYSPTVTPDGAHISVVRVEADGTQRLWRFTVDGGQPELVLANVKPVGYHAWVDDRTLALYVLGTPATLQIAETQTGTPAVVARGIGRSLQKIPGGTTVSFVQREGSVLHIRELEPKGGRITPLVDAVTGAAEADCAWTPDGVLLMAHGDVLYKWKRGDAAWIRIADLAPLGLHGVTRMAVSPSGDRIAFVTQ